MRPRRRSPPARWQRPGRSRPNGQQALDQVHARPFDLLGKLALLAAPAVLELRRQALRLVGHLGGLLVGLGQFCLQPCNGLQQLHGVQFRGPFLLVHRAGGAVGFVAHLLGGCVRRFRRVDAGFRLCFLFFEILVSHSSQFGCNDSISSFRSGRINCRRRSLQSSRSSGRRRGELRRCCARSAYAPAR